MYCRANDWRALSARSIHTNEWRAISTRHVRNYEWRAVSARHVVVEVTSRRARSRSETRVDNGLRGHWRNTPLCSWGFHLIDSSMLFLEGALKCYEEIGWAFRMNWLDIPFWYFYWYLEVSLLSSGFSFIRTALSFMRFLVLLEGRQFRDTLLLYSPWRENVTGYLSFMIFSDVKINREY